MVKPDLRPMSMSRPDLAADFHPTMNGHLTPDDVVAGTGKRLQWKCSKCSHEWSDTGNNRVRGRRCTFCKSGGLHSDGRNSIASLYSKIVKEIHPDKNPGINPWKLTRSSNKVVNWICETCSNEWPCTIQKRTVRGDGCGYCNNGRLHSDGRNSLMNSHLIRDFNFEKNSGIDPSRIVIGASITINWKCKDCNHEWRTKPNNRRKADGKWSGCAVCNAGRIHSNRDNSLQKSNPDLFIEIHPTMNKGKNLDEVNAGSSDNIWWKCSNCSNEWKAPIRARSKDGDGCGYCNAGRLHSDGRNSLRRKAPELAEEFDLESNNPLTPNEITYASPTYVDWKCKLCEHTWNQSPKTRFRRRTGCPYCAPKGIDLAKSGHYYVIRIMSEGDTILYKGGISNNYQKRFQQHVFNFADHRKSSEWDLQMEEVHSFNECSIAKELEKRLLKTEIRAPSISGLSSELFLSNPLELARNLGLI